MSDQTTTSTQPRPSSYRRILARIPGLRSAWYLGHAFKDMMLDGSARSQFELQQDLSQVDPWHYTTNELEMQRHRREVAMLDCVRGSNRFGRVLELGCAEGTFTEFLANRCDSLLATDFNEVALTRARQRRQWDEHVNFALLDLRSDPLPNVFDLILAIHVLDYIHSPIPLRRIREKLIAGLRPGGYLFIGCVSHDSANETAWWSRYLLRGGEQITAFFAEHRELRVVDSAIYPLAKCTSRDILFWKGH